MAARSAGILAFRKSHDGPEVLLVHPGGPFWATRDYGAWSIPKGEYEAGENVEAAARREFLEETGWPSRKELLPLGEVRQKSGKIVIGFAMEADYVLETLHSNDFEMEWPPRSGRMGRFPEVDRAGWFNLDEALEKVVEGQRPFIERLRTYLADL